MAVDRGNIFYRLRKLFNSGAIIRHVGGKELQVVDTDFIQSYLSNAYRDRYSRIFTSAGMLNNLSNQYGLNTAFQTQRIMLFRTYEIMDCVFEDTKIPLLDGTSPTIKELAERYSNRDEHFWVYSYDAEHDRIVPGSAFYPRLKGTRPVKKITFDDGKELIATYDHEILMRNGQYSKVKDLVVGESVMPFYQKDFYKSGYRFLYNFKKGWQAEHRIIAEAVYRESAKDEVVHHIDFDKTNNNPENLVIMTKSAHSAYHLKINEKIWSPENYERQAQAIRDSMKYRNTHRWNGERAGEGNPFFGRQHSEKSNLQRSNKLKELIASGEMHINYGEDVHSYRHDITPESIQEAAIKIYKTHGKLNFDLIHDVFHCDKGTLVSRVGPWNLFKKNIIKSLNHKIVSIVDFGEKPVYDLSVEKYHNFATDICFVHNCAPMISAALDIMMEHATLKNQFGDVLRIECESEHVKEILHNLFYDVLNIQFNVRPWVRNLLKYGDMFLFLEINAKYGIIGAQPLSVYDTQRIENEDPANPHYVYFQTMGMNGQKMKFENYEICHFRLLTDLNLAPFGKCLDKNAMILMEDSSEKAINTIVVGDKVWSFNITTQQYEITTVTNTSQSGIKEIFKVSTEHTSVNASANHQFLVSKNQKFTYKTVSELEVGDLLVHCRDTRFWPVMSINATNTAETFDIQVDSPNANFIANRIVVHNSYLEGARRSFQQLTMLEDAMLVQQIMRAPERRIIKLDVGNIPPAEIDTYMQRIADKMKKVPFIDPKTGEYNLRYNMETVLQDYYLPVRGSDAGTSIEVLPGLNWDSTNTLEYVRNMVLTALRIPRSFLWFQEPVGDKSSLAASDVRFSRTIEWFQEIIIAELKKIAVIHLYTQGFQDEDLVNFELHFTPPSTIYEQEKLNLLKEQTEVATQMQALKLLSMDWIYKEVFNLSDDEIERQKNLVLEDTKHQFRVGQIEAGQPDPAKYGFPQDQPLAATPDDGQQQESDNPVGRPEKGMRYGQDSHVRGRDPLGAHELRTSMRSPNIKLRHDKPKSPLSLEMLTQLDKKLGQSSSKKMLTEHADDSELLDASEDTNDETE